MGNCSKLTTWKDGPGPQVVGRCLACFTLTFQKKWRHQEMKITLHLRTQKHKKNLIFVALVHRELEKTQIFRVFHPRPTVALLTT